MRHARVDSSLSGAMHLVPFSSMYSEPVLPPPKYAQMIPAHVNKYEIIFLFFSFAFSTFFKIFHVHLGRVA